MRSRRAIGSSAGLTDATGRAKRALAEMQIELQNMLDEINADRAARLDRPWDAIEHRERQPVAPVYDVEQQAAVAAFRVLGG